MTHLFFRREPTSAPTAVCARNKNEIAQRVSTSSLVYEIAAVDCRSCKSACAHYPQLANLAAAAGRAAEKSA